MSVGETIKYFAALLRRMKGFSYSVLALSVVGSIALLAQRQVTLTGAVAVDAPKTGYGIAAAVFLVAIGLVLVETLRDSRMEVPDYPGIRRKRNQ